MKVATSIPDFTIRSAVVADVALILSFIKDLAEYERLSHQVVASEAELERTLFGERPTAEVIIGEYNEAPVAFALFSIGMNQPLMCIALLARFRWMGGPCNGSMAKH